MYEIVFYVDDKGNSPVEKFIRELDTKALKSKQDKIVLKQIIHQINILENLGTRAGENFTKYIEGDIWELRPGERRVLFSVWIDNKIVLLHMFHKKTNKTPKKEIDKAIREMSDWLSRNKGRGNSEELE